MCKFWEKEESITVTEADKEYKQLHNKCSHMNNLVKHQIEVLQQTKKVYDLLGLTEWADKVLQEKEKTVRLYYQWIDAYNECKTYGEKNHADMIMCADWNETLLNPDKGIRRWVK